MVTAAAGRVVALRDGSPDRLVRSDEDRAAIGNLGCGNGVLIDHGSGWTTQYCHMRNGSVAVRRGDRLAAGARLGKVGYSGAAAFPHVHLTVRKDGQPIDPFRPSADSTCGSPGLSLWTPDAAAALAYRRSAVLRGGFAPAPVEIDDLESGRQADRSPTAGWPALVVYAWAINLEQGDEMVVRLAGPGGVASENRVVLDRPKAQFMLFAGKKRPAAGWRPGVYVASVEIYQDRAVRLVRQWRSRLN